MIRLRQRVLIVTAVAAVLLGACGEGLAQSMRRVRVYNPRVYNNTRRVMNDRAAARAAVKKKRHRAKAKKRRPTRRVTG